MFFCTNQDENFIFEKIHKEKNDYKGIYPKQVYISKPLEITYKSKHYEILNKS